MKLPYGYKLNQNNEIIVNEQNAAAVKLISESYLSGNSLGGIVKILGEKHIPIVGMETYFEVQFEKTPAPTLTPIQKNERPSGTVRTMRQAALRFR